MTRRKNKTKRMYWVIIVVLFVIAGAVVYLVWNNYFRNKDGEIHNDDTTQVAEKKDKADDADSSKKGDSGNIEQAIETEEEEKEKEKEKIVAYEGADPNKGEELTGVVTYGGVNGDTLMIRVNIDQYLDSGVCELSLEGSGMYSDTANIVGNAATATCEGFNVPMGELGPGAYQIVIRVNSGEKSGIIRGAVEI